MKYAPVVLLAFVFFPFAGLGDTGDTGDVSRDVILRVAGAALSEFLYGDAFEVLPEPNPSLHASEKEKWAFDRERLRAKYPNGIPLIIAHGNVHKEEVPEKFYYNSVRRELYPADDTDMTDIAFRLRLVDNLFGGFQVSYLKLSSSLNAFVDSDDLAGIRLSVDDFDRFSNLVDEAIAEYEEASKMNPPVEGIAEGPGPDKGENQSPADGEGDESTPEESGQTEMERDDRNRWMLPALAWILLIGLSVFLIRKVCVS